MLGRPSFPLHVGIPIALSSAGPSGRARLMAVEWLKRLSNTRAIDASVELPTRDAAARTARLMRCWLAEQ
jgi:hypothetical protein